MAVWGCQNLCCLDNKLKLKDENWEIIKLQICKDMPNTTNGPVHYIICMYKIKYMIVLGT